MIDRKVIRWRGEREWVVVGDEAYLEEEWAELQRRRQHDRDRYQHPERRASVFEAVRRFRERYPERVKRIKRESNWRARRHPVGSLHALACSGPTKATGCRCSKIVMYDKP